MSLLTTNRTNKILSIWLLIVCFMVTVMVVYGGYVRLTRSGLSIVEWQVITGAVPPLNETAWQTEFNLYRQTPEYQKVNTNMSLPEYKAIYYREYIHRLLGRLTGLVYVLPLFIFLLKGMIPRQKIWIHLVIGLLFAGQGFMGWYMVQSGLVDRPSVSHYRLTAHLLLALLLLGLCFWQALNFLLGQSASKRAAAKPGLFALSVSLIGIVLVQIFYGGLMAGLKAGHVSDTFPLMFGHLIPPGLLSTLTPWYINLLNDMTAVHFVHRWLAFIVFALAGAMYFYSKKEQNAPQVQTASLIIVGLVGVQILFGLGVIIWHVPTWLALTHQISAFAIFIVALYINHQLPGTLPAPVSAPIMRQSLKQSS